MGHGSWENPVIHDLFSFVKVPISQDGQSFFAEHVEQYGQADDM